jgi:hypothetical protein
VSKDLVPVDVQIDEEMIRIRFSGGLKIATPVAEFPRLAHAEASMRKRWEVNGRGYGIHWPDVDEDISVSGLIARATERHNPKMPEVA